MILGKSYEERRQRLQQKRDRKWTKQKKKAMMPRFRFAWYPLILNDGRVAFWEFVECRTHIPRVDSVAPYDIYFPTKIVPADPE